jgi:hypothetical protein
LQDAEVEESVDRNAGHQRMARTSKGPEQQWNGKIVEAGEG